MKTKVPCPRCAARGGFECYRHVQNGVCFRCKGACWVTREVPESAEERYLRLEREAIIACDGDIVERMAAEAADRYAARETGTHDAI